MGEPGDTISQDEYERWLHPVHVLADLGSVISTEVLVREIASSLRDGLITAAAETIVVPGQPERAQFHLLDPRLWLDWACIADGAFWQTGNREIFSDSAPCRRHGFPPMRLYRVRFEPTGIWKLRPPPPPWSREAEKLPDRGPMSGRAELLADSEAASEARKAAEATRRLVTTPLARLPQAKATKPRRPGRKIPVSYDEFMVWFRGLAEIDQAKGYRWIWAEAKRHFYPRTVLKKWPVELVEGRSLGRKPRG